MKKLKQEFDVDKLLTDLGKYLESKGWLAIVIDERGIVQGNRKYNYDLVFSFTGMKKLLEEEKNETKKT